VEEERRTVKENRGGSERVGETRDREAGDRGGGGGKHGGGGKGTKKLEGAFRRADKF